MSIENEAQYSELDESTQKLSKFQYTRDFLLSLSELEVCKRLPGGFKGSKLWQSKNPYTRDFLLSLSELEVCRKLPGGFNGSKLCEFDDASTSRFDIQETLGSFLSHKSQGSRFGSSYSARCVTGNSSRGSGGKHEIHPSGRNNEVSRSQCDHDLGDESHHSQYFRQYGGHKGLLGSATLSNVFQSTASTLDPKVEAQLQYELRKSDNPYRPPHSYKAVTKAEIETELCTKEPSSYAEYRIREREKEEKTKGVESDRCALHASMEGNSRNYEENHQIRKPNSVIGFQKNFESDAVPLCLRSLSETETSKLSGFPFSVAYNNFLHFGDECRPAVTNSEGIKAGNFLEITEVDNTQVNQSYDDDWDEIVSMLHKEQESELPTIILRDRMSGSTSEINLPDEDCLIAIDDTLIPQKLRFTPEIPPHVPKVESNLNPVPGCNELASEYSLPDENSLILMDDLIIPQHSVSTSGGNSSKDCMLLSNVTKEISDNYLAQNAMPWDGKPAVPGYYGMTTLQNFYHNQHSQLSYLQFYHSQINSGWPSFHALYAHRAQMHSQTIFMDPKMNFSHLKHHLNAQYRPSGSKTKSKKPNLSSHSVLKQQTVLPLLQNELFIGPSLPDYVARMTSPVQVLNPMQMWPSNYAKSRSWCWRWIQESSVVPQLHQDGLGAKLSWQV